MVTLNLVALFEPCEVNFVAPGSGVFSILKKRREQYFTITFSRGKGIVDAEAIKIENISFLKKFVLFF